MTIYSLGAKEKMPQPYSYDLRQKVIQAIELDGMSQNQAAMAFHIGRSTINVEVHGARAEEKVEFHQHEQQKQIQPKNQEYYALAD